MKIIPTLLAFLPLIVASASADEDTRRIEKEILQDILRNTTITVKPIDNPSVAKCFACTFYEARIRTREGDTSTTRETTCAMTPGGVKHVQFLGSSSEIKELPALLLPSFRLKKGADGETMLAALQAIYGEQFVDRDFEMRISRKGSTWSFVTGKFFKKFSGVVMKTDATGRITSIKRSLSIVE